MMPLWTTATSSVWLVCGWAFSSVGGPCVLQRVWPMPTFPFGTLPTSASFSSDTWPERLYTEMPDPFWTATPAESYPRYSRFSSPETSFLMASPSPTRAMIPHILRRLLVRYGLPVSCCEMAPRGNRLEPSRYTSVCDVWVLHGCVPPAAPSPRGASTGPCPRHFTGP